MPNDLGAWLQQKSSAFQYIITNLKASQPCLNPLTPLKVKTSRQNWCKYWGDLSTLQSWDSIVNIIERGEQKQEKQFLQTLCSCPFSLYSIQSWPQHSGEDSAIHTWHRGNTRGAELSLAW